MAERAEKAGESNISSSLTLSLPSLLPPPRSSSSLPPLFSLLTLLLPSSFAAATRERNGTTVVKTGRKIYHEWGEKTDTGRESTTTITE